MKYRLKQTYSIQQNKSMAFNAFCNIEPIKYWRLQLNVANTKNIKNESQLGGTRNVYTYGLFGFHKWLCNRSFKHTKLISNGKDQTLQSTSVLLSGIEHLLKIRMENNVHNTDFARLIKEYLAELSLEKSQSTVKNAIYAIRSFFGEHESDIVFRFKHKIDRYAKKHQLLLSLDDLKKIMTTDHIQPIERAVFLCKFQRGLDNATFVDRFNFEAWDQIIQHFGSDDPRSWDIKNTPVPIHLERVKTGFPHTGFLDADAITAIVCYLNTREKNPQYSDALFINTRKKPITVNWISRRFYKLVRKLAQSNYQDLGHFCSSHEMRDLLKSTLIDSGCRPDVADHVLGHCPRDSYEKQTLLYPDSVMREFAKASSRINILTNFCKDYSQQKSPKSANAINDKVFCNVTDLVNSIQEIQNHVLTQNKRLARIERHLRLLLESPNRLN